jgi:hypothetical protein
MQIPSPPSPTLPNHDPPPSSAEEKRSKPPSGAPPPAASSSSQAGGRVGGRGPREDPDAEAPPAYTAFADGWQGETTLEDRLRRPFERVNRRQRPPPLQQQYAPPPQMPPFIPPLLPRGMRSVNVSYQRQRYTGQYQYQQQDQPPPQPPRSSSPPVSSANIPPAPPQHPHSRTATQPPDRSPSPPSTSSASSGTTTPLSDFTRDVTDFVQDVTDFARDISDFARDFYAAGDWSEERKGGPSGSSSSASPSARTASTITVIHNVTRDQNHIFAFSFWGIARAFYGMIISLSCIYLADIDGECYSISCVYGIWSSIDAP